MTKLKYLIPVGIVIAFLLVLHFYGNARYDAGVKDTNQSWAEASAALQDKADRAAKTADEESALRVQDYTNQLVTEKAKIDEATSNGSSPFDVLFNPNGVR